MREYPHDPCPKCEKKTLPPRRPDSHANARQCQNQECRWIEEFDKSTIPFKK